MFHHNPRSSHPVRQALLQNCSLPAKQVFIELRELFLGHQFGHLVSPDHFPGLYFESGLQFTKLLFQLFAGAYHKTVDDLTRLTTT